MRAPAPASAEPSPNAASPRPREVDPPRQPVRSPGADERRRAPVIRDAEARPTCDSGAALRSLHVPAPGRCRALFASNCNWSAIAIAGVPSRRAHTPASRACHSKAPLGAGDQPGAVLHRQAAAEPTAAGSRRSTTPNPCNSAPGRRIESRHALNPSAKRRVKRTERARASRLVGPGDGGDLALAIGVVESSAVEAKTWRRSHALSLRERSMDSGAARARAVHKPSGSVHNHLQRAR